jgi:hypothetical protein
MKEIVYQSRAVMSGCGMDDHALRLVDDQNSRVFVNHVEGIRHGGQPGDRGLDELSRDDVSRFQLLAGFGDRGAIPEDSARADLCLHELAALAGLLGKEYIQPNGGID